MRAHTELASKLSCHSSPAKSSFRELFSYLLQIPSGDTLNTFLETSASHAEVCRMRSLLINIEIPALIFTSRFSFKNLNLFSSLTQSARTTPEAQSHHHHNRQSAADKISMRWKANSRKVLAVLPDYLYVVICGKSVNSTRETSRKCGSSVKVREFVGRVKISSSTKFKNRVLTKG